MNSWLRDQLERLGRLRQGDVGVVLDPESLVAKDILQELAFDAEVLHATDWWTLRRSYERHARRRPADQGPLLIIVAGVLGSTALPWDIEHASRLVVRVSLPGPPPVRRVLAQISGEEADRAVVAVAHSVDPVGALLEVVGGSRLEPVGQVSRRDQLSVVARLAARADLRREMRNLVFERISEPRLRAVIAEPPDTSGIQTAWEEWIAKGTSSSWHHAFSGCPGEVAALFVAGLLHPVLGDNRGHPDWVAIGLRSPTVEERIRVLLGARPTPWPPDSAAAWTAAAAWWGEIRGLAAGRTQGPLADELDAAWRELNVAFGPWLRTNYGQLLLSAAAWPSAVHRIASFVARRLRSGLTNRVLLLVLDGMGFAQWSRLRERTGITLVESGGTFAMLPTYTTVSRQAIFAGQLPNTFANTLWETKAEPQRWEAFWTNEGLRTRDIAYHRVDGRYPQDRIELDQEKAVGVVVNAVDELMHGSELLGDAQVAVAVDAWADTGYLRDIVERATGVGYEVWITADHGNIECRPAGWVAEGVVVEASGKRLRRYPNRILRDASAAEGIVWDDIPGLPSQADPLLIAPDRLAFMSQEIAVSHGGLSLDEVIVPLAWVRP